MNIVPSMRQAARSAAALALLPLAGIAVSSPASAHDSVHVDVVADGLSNPRGVEIGPDGSVYVAEAGVGGGTLAEALVEGQPGWVCYGDTGAITRVDDHRRIRRLDGFPSTAEAAGTPEAPVCDDTVGFAATGPHDVAIKGRRQLTVTIGLGGDLASRADLPARLGTVERVRMNGRTRPLADLVVFEETDPAGDGPDSNPYGVAMFGRSAIVADAGGNDLLQVRPNGRVTTLATFGPDFDTTVPTLSCGNPPFLPPPGTPIPAQAVPTAVDVHDGYAYVGFLTGFPFNAGTSEIVRIDLRTGSSKVVATGLTNVVGLDVAPDHSIYAVEIARNGLLEAEICGDLAGRLVRIDHGEVEEIDVPGGLVAPGGVAVADDGTVYVSVGSIFPSSGQLLAIHDH